MLSWGSRVVDKAWFLLVKRYALIKLGIERISNTGVLFPVWIAIIVCINLLLHLLDLLYLVGNLLLLLLKIGFILRSSFIDTFDQILINKFEPLVFVLVKNFINLCDLLYSTKILLTIEKLNSVVFVMIRIRGRRSRFYHIFPLEFQQHSFTGPK